MDGLRCILYGLASIFGVWGASPRHNGVEQLRQKLDAYIQKSDRERLASDWWAIGGDMRKALDKIEQANG